ncbi:MAG: tetratricopeptide repeat protein [Pseudomonadota bacterium]
MTSPRSLIVGEWRVDGPGCRIDNDGEAKSLEPKVMDLLLLLARHPGEVVGRQALLSALWPGVVVGEDTLARTVSKLRGALDDDAKQPAYIETIPKRGYRLIAEVSSEQPSSGESRQLKPWLIAGVAVLFAALAGVLLVGGGEEGTTPSDTELLAGRADDFYMRFEQADNAAAIDLYERVIAREPEHARAHAGLASALVQRVIRWPEGLPGLASLTDALEQGYNETPQALELLERARLLAERGVELAPDDPKTLKALGLVLATSGRLEEARGHYERAVAANDDAWESLINLGELAESSGDLPAAVDYFTQSYEVMQRLYDREPQRVGPWHAPLGNHIAGMHNAMGNLQEAEAWYRRILRLSPYDAAATGGLAQILAASGDLRQALSLCRNLVTVGSSDETCDVLLAKSATSP